MSYSEKEIKKLIKKNLTPWLIKSSGQVLGPFSRREIEKKIRTREFVALDEVSIPLERWRYLKDQPEFIKAINEAKVASKDNESTMTSTVNGSDELTETLLLDDNSDLTPNIRSQMIGRAEKESIKEIKSENIREKTLDNNGLGSQASYGYSEDRNIKKEINTFSKFTWIFVFIFIVGATLFVYQEKESVENFGIKEGLDNLSEKGIEAKSIGEFKVAINFFKKALALNPKETETLLHLIPLSLVYESDFVFSRKKIQDILNFHSDRKFLRDANALMGLANLLDLRVNQAEEFLRKSLEYDTAYLPSRLNLAVVFYLKKNYTSLVDYFEKKYFLGSLDGAAIMLVVNSYTELFRQTDDQNYLLKAGSLIDEYLLFNQEYQQEFLLMKLYIETVLLKQVKPDLIERIINVDPYISQEHWHDPVVYREHMKWEALQPMCDEIYNTSRKTGRDNGLYGLCLIKSNKTVEAEKYINDGLAKTPNDSLLIALQALLFISKNDEQAGVRLLTHALRDSPSELGISLKGRYCQEPSVEECSSSRWKELLNVNSKSLVAFSRLAKNSIDNKNYERAKSLNDMGLSISKSYKPFLKNQFFLEKLGAEEGNGQAEE